VTGSPTISRITGVPVRVSLLVALVVETLNVLLGGGLGLLAGFFGGWVDRIILRIGQYRALPDAGFHPRLDDHAAGTGFLLLG